MKNKNWLKPWYWSIVIVVVLVLWLVSGCWTSIENAEQKDSDAETFFSVRCRLNHAEEMLQGLCLYGETQSNKSVELKAETAAQVMDVYADRGEHINKDAIIVQLDVGDRQAVLNEAKAFLRLKEREHEVAMSLENKGYEAKNRLLVTEAEQERAKTNVVKARQSLDKTQIKAPFEGVIAEKFVDEGSYVVVGSPFVTLIDNDPLKVEVFVSQTEIEKVFLDQQAEVLLATGEIVEGAVKVISPEADNTTRTFGVEVEIPNKKKNLLVGVSAEVKLKSKPVKAHHFSPQLLCLNGHDTLGVKCVDENNEVIFYPVTIFNVDSDEVWVGGLPEEVCLITVGHLFVQPGDKVKPVEE